MAIYLQIGKIKGNVSAKGHEDWIECSSLQFGVGRAIPMSVGTQSNREASHPSLSEISLSKQMDDSSPYLFQESVVGESKTVKIHVTKTGANQLESIVEYTLDSSLISSYSLSSGGDQPSESFSLSFTKIEMKYVVWDEAHSKSSQIPISYDLATATAN
ncbi:type VI secretion system tube protein Hcp [bacterium]|nr:type VI secretion system tube protein Hcp [bacterium]